MDELYGVAIVPLIIGMVSLINQLGINKKYAGLVAWVIGLALGLAYGLTEGGWSVLESIIIGSAVGVSATGLYSAQKNVRQIKK